MRSMGPRRSLCMRQAPFAAMPSAQEILISVMFFWGTSCRHVCTFVPYGSGDSILSVFHLGYCNSTLTSMQSNIVNHWTGPQSMQQNPQKSVSRQTVANIMNYILKHWTGANTPTMCCRNECLLQVWLPGFSLHCSISAQWFLPILYCNQDVLYIDLFMICPEIGNPKIQWCITISLAATSGEGEIPK